MGYFGGACERLFFFSVFVEVLIPLSIACLSALSMKYVSGKYLLTQYKAVVVLVYLSEVHVVLELTHLVSFYN